MILPTARRVVIWRTQHTPRVFVERLDFVSAVGNLDRVVTPLAVLQRLAGRLQIESVHAWTTVEEIRAQTGFTLPDGEARENTPPPSDEELRLLASVDPERVRDLEFA
jgi:glutaconate CoA-transferase subunit B